MRRPPFDPDLEDALAESPLPAVIAPEMIEGVREIPFAAPIAAALGGREVDHSERRIAGPDGELTVSVFTPRRKATPGPGFFYIHGGGMIMGDRFTGVDILLDWIEELGGVCVSIEYRLAPEHPDPAPIDDCYAGLLWMAGQSAALGIDPERLVVAGTSAGGGLAAGVALMARDREGGPAILAQLLMSPMLDDRNDTTSARQYSEVGAWSRESNATGWEALLGERRGGNEVSEYAAPARATDLAGLPTAYLDVGSAEVFRDEDVAYAGGLWAAGVQAELHVWPGGFHMFDSAVPDAAISVAARAARTAWVRRTVSSHSRSKEAQRVR